MAAYGSAATLLTKLVSDRTLSHIETVNETRLNASH
jgi:hypothetical protein